MLDNSKRSYHNTVHTRSCQGRLGVCGMDTSFVMYQISRPLTNSTSEAIVLTLPLEHIQSMNRTLQEAAKTAISCSQQIFLAHKQLEWNPSCPLI